LISFVLYLSALSGAFNSLGGIYASLVRAVGAADKVFELMNRKPRISEPDTIDQDRVQQALKQQRNDLLGDAAHLTLTLRAKGRHPEKCDGQVVFDNVVYSYPARPERTVLKRLNLSVPAGSIYAIVGPSGSGKSSIVKLLQRMYEPNSGTVSIDNISVNNISPDWLSRHVAVVQQEPVLFARSVKRNIIYGLEGTPDEPSQSEIVEAARLANAASFIEALPDGYESDVVRLFLVAVWSFSQSI